MQEVTDEHIAAYFDKVIELLGETGWCQRVRRDGQGRICALTALTEVNDRVEVVQEAHRRLLRLVKSSAGGYSVSISTWNDTPGMTLEQVIGMISEAKGIVASTT